jgi:hypothetical protein
MVDDGGLEAAGARLAGATSDTLPDRADHVTIGARPRWFIA